MNAEETKRQKAEALRYKKPIVKDLNLDSIKERLWDIQGECEDVRWYFDTDDDTLINALDGDEDEAYEFKMMFADLCAECDQMVSDLGQEWVPDCFDKFFVAAGAGDYFGGIIGFDTYEKDYYGIGCASPFAEDEAKKTLKRMTKDELIAAARQCLKIYQGYIALSNRYDCLKAALDILRDQNTGYLQMVRQIEELYEKAEEESLGFRYETYGKSMKEFNSYVDALPQEAWLQ